VTALSRRKRSGFISAVLGRTEFSLGNEGEEKCRKALAVKVTIRFLRGPLKTESPQKAHGDRREGRQARCQQSGESDSDFQRLDPKSR
jgi:hypothetical protein